MIDASEERVALRKGFAARFAGLGLPLELIAEDVLGDGDEPIDWIAAAPDGRAWLVLLELGSGGAALLERALVQRAWAEARIPDWRQLAPELSLRAELTPAVLLVARDHPRSTCVAAREVGDGVVQLARWTGSASEPSLEMLVPPPRPRRPTGRRAAQLTSIFRTGLDDTDLAS